MTHLRCFLLSCSFSTLLVFTPALHAETTRELVVAIADRLVDEQRLPDGNWEGDQLFTGLIVAGLADAYEMTCDDVYRQAAERGGNYILSLYPESVSSMYGDEAYALSCLGRMQSASDEDNPYSAKIEAFYETLRLQPGGTNAYINDFAYDTNITTAVFYLSYHTLAAYSVDAFDKLIWRTNLIHFLAHVDDDYNFENLPVTAIGIATWALAKTGSLDTTKIKIYGFGTSYWNDLMLKDLPFVLQMQQCNDLDNPYAGTFFWRLDHDYGLGYTEDSVYGIMGLAAARNADIQRFPFDANVNFIRNALRGAVELTPGVDSGKVYAHIDPSLVPISRPYYAGQMLTALSEAQWRVDLDLDDSVTFFDLVLFLDKWLCTDSAVCGPADFDHDGQVNLSDFALLAENW